MHPLEKPAGDGGAVSVDDSGRAIVSGSVDLVSRLAWAHFGGLGRLEYSGVGGDAGPPSSSKQGG